MSRLITLTQGYFTTVSDEDFLYLLNWKWYVRIDNHGNIYAIRNSNKKERNENKSYTIFMHSVISERMGLKGSPDHKDRNGLNNQRNNLREASFSQQRANRNKFQNVKSKYKGVFQYHNKYQAFIGHNGKIETLGMFITEIEAAWVYDYNAIKYFGEFAVLNFPESRELYKF